MFSFIRKVDTVPVQSARAALEQAEVVGDLKGAAKKTVEVLTEHAALMIEGFAVGRDGYVTVELEGSVGEDEYRGDDEFTVAVRRVPAPDDAHDPQPSQPTAGATEPVEGEPQAPPADVPGEGDVAPANLEPEPAPDEPDTGTPTGDGQPIEPEPEPEPIDATDAAVELAVQEGIELADVEGTGQGGRITKGDVEAALESEQE